MPVSTIGVHVTAETISFVSNNQGTHEPSKYGMTYVSGQVYVNARGTYFLRQAESKCKKHYRTGKPAYTVAYVGLNSEFEVEHLEAILKHMKGKK
jgi:hypothetical protein